MSYLLGTNIPSIIDNQGLSPTGLKICAPSSHLESAKIGLAIIHPNPTLVEIYLENQDGQGNRLGNLTLGVDHLGAPFIGGAKPLKIINTSSPYPHSTFPVETNSNLFLIIPIVIIVTILTTIFYNYLFGPRNTNIPIDDIFYK